MLSLHLSQLQRSNPRTVLQAISRRSSTLLGPVLHISDEVRDAVRSRKPVVALETTIYTHGFPYPDNIDLAFQLEAIVRRNGGVPATIGVLRGQAKVGMQRGEIEELLETAGRPDTIKVSRRDLGYICGLGTSGRKLNGGTTIAGTLVLSQLAGIKVFATGGLGGVHKGGEVSLDISADLTELGRTPVALVSSGCKSFLDIPRTLEYLETQGVGVATFADGRDGPVDFPAFWTRESGVRSPSVVRDEREAAAIIYAQNNLRLASGLLFTNPIPEEHSLPKSMMDKIMAQAVQDAETKGISGSANTPFVLSRIRELTKGATVSANKVLVECNVEKGTRVAVELSKLEANGRDTLPSQTQSQDIWEFSGRALSSDAQHDKTRHSENGAAGLRNVSVSESKGDVDVIVAGSIALDTSCDYAPIERLESINARPLSETSNPAVISQSLGGVGQNVATASHLSGTTTRLFSVIGEDPAGQAALAILRQRGMDTSGISVVTSHRSTGQYVAVNGVQRDLVLAMADFRILEGEQPAFEGLWELQLEYCNPKWLVVDANWEPPVLKRWLTLGRKVGAKIAYEPVSVEKAPRILFESWRDHLDSITRNQNLETRGHNLAHSSVADLVTPNEMELLALSRHKQSVDAWSCFLATIPDETLLNLIRAHLHDAGDAVPFEITINALRLLSQFPCILTKLGSNGVLHTELLELGDYRLSAPDAARHIFCRSEARYSNIVMDSRPPILIPEVDPSSSLRRIAGVYMRHFPVAEKLQPEDIISVNGVGDTFLGVLVAGLAKGIAETPDQLIMHAQKGAAMTLKSKESVSPKLGTLKWNNLEVRDTSSWTRNSDSCV